MPQFLVVHNVEQYPATQEEWISIWHAIHTRGSDKARWLQSFFDAETGKMYCEWEATSIDNIKACLDEVILQMAPIESLREIVLFNPEWLDELTS